MCVCVCVCRTTIFPCTRVANLGMHTSHAALLDFYYPDPARVEIVNLRFRIHYLCNIVLSPTHIFFISTVLFERRTRKILYIFIADYLCVWWLNRYSRGLRRQDAALYICISSKRLSTIFFRYIANLKKSFLFHSEIMLLLHYSPLKVE